MESQKSVAEIAQAFRNLHRAGVGASYAVQVEVRPNEYATLTVTPLEVERNSMEGLEHLISSRLARLSAKSKVEGFRNG
jgi:hypothetical protein